MKNLMDVYIDFTKKKIKKYMKMIFGKMYNEVVVEEYLKTYVNARYYNAMQVDKPAKAFYLRISNELKYKEKILNKKLEDDLEDKSIIKYTRQIFDYVLFFDNVRKVQNVKDTNTVKEIVNDISVMRERWFKVKNLSDFAEKLYTQINNDMLEKDIFLDKFENDDFILNIKNHEQIENLYYVKIENKIKMPIQYSQYAVNKVFTSGTIAEDKLKIEYILLSVMSIRDILNGNFEDIYIAEFNPSLLKKTTKLVGVLGIIGNQALQEKINLNIMYQDYMKHRNEILNFVNEGYNFVITLDGTVKSVMDVEKLKMFKKVIVPQNLALYKNIKKAKISNVIEQ